MWPCRIGRTQVGGGERTLAIKVRRHLVYVSPDFRLVSASARIEDPDHLPRAALRDERRLRRAQALAEVAIHYARAIPEHPGEQGLERRIRAESERQRRWAMIAGVHSTVWILAMSAETISRAVW